MEKSHLNELDNQFFVIRKHIHIVIYGNIQAKTSAMMLIRRRRQTHQLHKEQDTRLSWRSLQIVPVVMSDSQ